MKKIAFTFAGRKKVMSRQVAFMRKAIDLGCLDEWHVWNFARKEEDRDWLKREFAENSVLATDSNSVSYIPLSMVETETLNIQVIARSDAHLLVTMNNGECIEIVIGAFSNTLSLLRKFDEFENYQLHAIPIQISNKVLNWDKENSINFDFLDDTFQVFLNGDKLFELCESGSLIKEVQVHTGYGSDGMWHTTAPGSRIKLMECGKAGYEGFRFVYFHYGQNRYADCIFVKLDDDIIYCDLNSIGDFFGEISRSEGNDIISANVINNGVCAYHQGKNNYFPDLDMDFEYPPDGTCGKLWGSAEMCENLHNYFLDNLVQIRDKATSDRRMTRLPQFDRFSINFVGFKHGLFLYMMAAYLADKSGTDDEHLMTKVVPKMFGAKKYVFNHLMVSHLSFFKQDETLESDKLIGRYLSLAI